MPILIEDSAADAIGDGNADDGDLDDSMDMNTDILHPNEDMKDLDMTHEIVTEQIPDFDISLNLDADAIKETRI